MTSPLFTHYSVQALIHGALNLSTEQFNKILGLSALLKKIRKSTWGKKGGELFNFLTSQACGVFNPPFLYFCYYSWVFKIIQHVCPHESVVSYLTRL